MVVELNKMWLTYWFCSYIIKLCFTFLKRVVRKFEIIWNKNWDNIFAYYKKYENNIKWKVS